METMVLSAIDKGITQLAITDHYDPGYPDPEFPFGLDFKNCQERLLEMENKYKSQIKIVKGMEIGIMEGQFDAARKEIYAFDYDFIIGSFHCLGSDDLYTFDFSKVNVPAMLEEFYLYVYKCLKTFKDYDVVGHLSIIDRYLGKAYDYRPYMDIIEEILKLVIYDGKGIEINTSSFKYGSDVLLPRLEILKLYKDLGGEILTIGSDAHEPKHFLSHFEETHALAQDIGFKHLATFSKRKPYFVAL